MIGANICSPTYARREINLHILVLMNFAQISTRQHPWYDEKVLGRALADLPNISYQLKRLLPLIYHNARRLNLFDDLPASTKALLKNSTSTAIADTLLKNQWLQQAITLFAEEKIPIILLKSAAFASTLYPESAPRPGTDLDLLVKQKDFDNASLLLEKGMSMQAHNSWQHKIPTHTYEQSFVQSDGISPAIDVHCALTTPFLFRIEEQALWQRSHRHPAYQNKFARILCPEDTLLHQAIHAYRDFDFCTHNLVDSHEVICQWQPKPELLIDRATEWGAKHVLFCLLENCQTIMASPISTELKTALKPSGLREKIGRRILQSNRTKLATNKTTAFRILQLTGQYIFPDRLTSALRHQCSYFFAQLTRSA